MAKTDIKQALKYSDYWTWFTEWLLGFGGKAAWPILIICTLYMGAELYPGVNLPSGINFVVFLAQLFALDMGGMGLVSIARQVKDAGHEEEAKQADSFGKVLVGIVITSLVTVGIKQFLSGVPALTANSIQHVKGTPDDSIMATYIEPCIMVVEFILVIARVVCAVLYGKVMHALKHTTDDSPTPPPALPAIDIQAEIAEAVKNLASELKADQARLFSGLQQQIAGVQNQIPVIDRQAIAGVVLTAMEPHFTNEMKRLQSEIHQQVSFSVEKKAQQYFSTSSPSEMGSSTGTRPGSRPSEIPPYGHGKSGNILPFHQEPAETSQEAEGRKALVLRLYHEDTSRSDSDIATLSGVPNTTVWRYLKPYRDRAKTGEMPAISKTETA